MTTAVALQSTARFTLVVHQKPAQRLGEVPSSYAEGIKRKTCKTAGIAAKALVNQALTEWGLSLFGLVCYPYIRERRAAARVRFGMVFFVETWFSAALLIVLFGVTGLGLVAPFAAELRFAFLAAPVAGMAFVPLIANAIYTVGGLGYRACLVISLAAAAAITVAQRRRAAWKSGFVQLAAAAVVASLVMIVLCDARAIAFGGPAIYFKVGTDQSGYAQMADWLLHFPVALRPVNDGGVWPYQSFPELLFDNDPRFGAFGLIALVSAATKVDGLFSYPLATVVFIGSGIVGCAALFTQRLAPFGLCAACLLASQWIDYGYTGFLGRTLGYPGIVFLAGVALRTPDGDRARLMALLVLSGAVGTTYPGFVVGILVATMLLPCLALRWLLCEPGRSTAGVQAGLIATAVPFLSSGVTSRPIFVGQIAQGLDWRTVLPRVFDLDDRTIEVTPLPPNAVLGLTVLALVFSAVLIVSALMRRQPDAAGLMLGPLAFVLLLVLAGRSSQAQEFAGFPYAALVVGGMMMVGVTRQMDSVMAAGLVAIEGLLRLPRLYAALSLFAYTPDPDYVFTLAEVQQIRRDIGARSVEIDSGIDLRKGLWLMSEIGQLRGQVSWAPDTWKTILGYRPEWTYSAPAAKAQIRIKPELLHDIDHHYTIETALP